ncbi:MBL fold metallo-hydrolase [Carboxydothermus ferrireducens]|uniref:Glyoxylase-like metal-dependent hydrolase (Beta-lactamase superfamily II) n=1 Tax=Carboxydothermus ferrireducens DSM 11255 TaxID=1119529 RepID=A0ABX2RA19_9THEO|nr:MBL fold metallo-hydrolase [Carboxydothermus ferrireducens]NYE58019.1 glyoxylase-like metal-dependent hydrolase (beta-lactamase superfamily II) [Carboxydothermus ferrireducens DSM 11255]
MQIKTLTVGVIAANCHIAWCEKTGEAVAIDPGGDGDKILRFIDQNGLKLKYIVLTHGHGDHIAAVDEVRNKTGAKVLIHPKDAPMLLDPSKNLSGFLGGAVKLAPADQEVVDGDEIIFGGEKLKVLHTPGHTLGSICIYGCDVLFSGDTLFFGSVGRVDFPGGSWEKLLKSIREKIFTLPEDTRVLPGHGPETTVGYEKEHNPFLKD